MIGVPCAARSASTASEHLITGINDVLEKLTVRRNPTLSYTARLEQRIRELEAQQAEILGCHRRVSASNGRRKDSSPGESQVDDPDAKGFDGLKVDHKGGITYHGITSFFQLPGDQRSVSENHGPFSEKGPDAIQRRERLVANAWRQRALEDLSEIPVRATAVPKILPRMITTLSLAIH